MNYPYLSEGDFQSIMLKKLIQHFTCFMERLRSSNFSLALRGFWNDYIQPNIFNALFGGFLAYFLYVESEAANRQAEIVQRLNQFIGDGDRVTDEVVSNKMSSNRQEVLTFILESEERLANIIRRECN